MVLETNVTGFLLGVVIGEVVPKHACFVLDESNICGDIGCVALTQRSTASFPWDIEHAPEFNEPGEAPVAFLLGESVMSSMVAI